MRCLKCGFISFDHQTSCAKCGKDITEVASELQGTSIKVATPMFLGAALASYADKNTYYGGDTMDDETAGGVDIAMDEEGADLSMSADEPESGVNVSFADADTEEAAAVEGEVESDVDFSIEADAGSRSAAAADDESIEELDLLDSDDEEEEGGLEFDLEDFIKDIDEDDSKGSSVK